MKILLRTFVAVTACCMFGLVGCSKDEPSSGDINDKPGDYGQLGGNLITIGSTRDVDYTSCVVLGTVDFPKITSDHTYGVVYMEALTTPDFDYDAKLLYQGHSNKTDKEQYDCVDAAIMSSSADGKFEKQLVGLKPNTVYYYRAYVSIGRNVNYSKVEMFTTKDPTPEITMTTTDASDIYAVAGTMNGVVNVGNLSDVNEDQEYGFVYSSAPQLNSPDKLTYEYYEQWLMNHFETEEDFDGPEEVTTTTNLNGRISIPLRHLRPGQTYYYRTFFKWNDKYFYSPEVKTLTTKGKGEISVGTNKATDIDATSAMLNGTVPFSNIGLETVTGGFLISNVYSNASEFTHENAVRWEDRRWSPNADVYFVSSPVTERDFSYRITGLSPLTTYHVVAYISLGTYEEGDDEVEEFVYGPVQQFVTTDEDIFTGSLEVYSEGNYPWMQIQNGVWKSGNTGISGSQSSLYINVSHYSGDQLKFNLTVSSEQGYDYVSIYRNGSQIGNTYSGDVRNIEVPITFNSDGSSIIRICYSKDSSGSVGDDSAIVSDIQLKH